MNLQNFSVFTEIKDFFYSKHLPICPQTENYSITVFFPVLNFGHNCPKKKEEVTREKRTMNRNGGQKKKLERTIFGDVEILLQGYMYSFVTEVFFVATLKVNLLLRKIFRGNLNEAI